jgi:hypothetical protein
MKKTLLLFLVLCLAISSISSAVIVASDDTWVREDSPDSNRNGNDQINARTDIDGDDNDVCLFRFDLTGGGIAASGNSLNLTWYRDDSSTGKTLSLYGMNDLADGETTWSESTITYNNAPMLIPDGQDPTAETGLGHDWDDVRDLDMSKLTLLVASQPYGPQVLGDLYTFSGAALDAFLNADTNGQVTLLVLRGDPSTSSNQARFQVKEVGTGAYLVPEPATMLLLGLGGLVSLRKRR